MEVQEVGWRGVGREQLLPQPGSPGGLPPAAYGGPSLLRHGCAGADQMLVTRRLKLLQVEAVETQA